MSGDPAVNQKCKTFRFSSREKFQQLMRIAPLNSRSNYDVWYNRSACLSCFELVYLWTRERNRRFHFIDGETMHYQHSLVHVAFELDLRQILIFLLAPDRRWFEPFRYATFQHIPYDHIHIFRLQIRFVIFVEQREAIVAVPFIDERFRWHPNEREHEHGEQHHSRQRWKYSTSAHCAWKLLNDWHSLAVDLMFLLQKIPGNNEEFSYSETKMKTEQFALTVNRLMQ